MSNAFEGLGLNSDDLRTLIEWAGKRTVTLKFLSEERCDYSREESHDEESTVKRVEKRKSKLNEETVTNTIVTTVTDHYWMFDSAYQIVVCRGVGSDSDDCVELTHGSNSMELRSKSVTSPPRTLGLVIATPIEVDITVLLKALTLQPDIAVESSFHIDRNATNCKTPSRNSEVDAIMLQSRHLHAWVASVTSTFFRQLLPLSSHQSKRGVLTADEVFIPVIPLFVDCSASDAVGEEEASLPERGVNKSQPQPSGVCVSSGSVSLSSATSRAFLREQVRTLAQAKQDVSKMFCCGNCSAGRRDTVGGSENESQRFDMKSCRDDVFTPHEARLVVTLLHLRDLCERVHSSVLYVEDLLHKQLSAAIGKEVSPDQLSSYMAFHNQKLFQPAYRPQQMTYAVRRSKSHSPEGRISMESRGSTGSAESVESPVYVVSRGVPFGSGPQEERVGDGKNASGGDSLVAASGAASLTMSLDASTEISLAGNMYVHAHLQHLFADDAAHGRAGGGEGGGALYLNAQARQFSSFILLVGRVPSESSFDPLFGVIVKNKDELRIPLDVAVIPSAKEFKDAIGSLSPEQQQFAKAFRTFQMQSTLFGVCVIQIKPQLEKVLNLPADSLTKEIELTENLMDLFIKYQIPSDMLSAEGGEANLPDGESGVRASMAAGKTVNNPKVAALNEVKSNVVAIQVLQVLLFVYIVLYCFPGNSFRCCFFEIMVLLSKLTCTPHYIL